MKYESCKYAHLRLSRNSTKQLKEFLKSFGLYLSLCRINKQTSTSLHNLNLNSKMTIITLASHAYATIEKNLKYKTS